MLVTQLAFRISELFYEDRHYCVSVRASTSPHVVQVGTLIWAVINEHTNVVVPACPNLPLN